jgi:hypothetical protein
MESKISDAPNPGALLNHIAETHWHTVARQGWRQYQQRGRGAVVFPTPQSGDAEDGGTAPLRYLTFQGTDDEIRASAMKMLHHLTTTYDPTREVVLALILPDDRTVFDVYARSPAPKTLSDDT